jgi:hypothetical protein
LNLKCDILVPKFAGFKCNLYRYSTTPISGGEEEGDSEGEGGGGDGGGVGSSVLAMVDIAAAVDGGGGGVAGRAATKAALFALAADLATVPGVHSVVHSGRGLSLAYNRPRV